ncbi:MAG: TraB/GumN family protein [Candidatus Hadarchaeales archaeon]
MLRRINNLLLIGVGHVLPKSLEKVKTKILEERPEIVAVELCPVRYAALTGGMGKGGGSPASPLSWLLGLVQDRFSSQTGMPAGREMITAIDGATQVGASILLIDQNIFATMERLRSLVPLREKFMLFVQILLALLPLHRKINLETLTEEAVAQNLIEDFRRFFPTAARILIDERDEYMVMKLLPLLASGKRIVCVVGAAHIFGMERLLAENLRETEKKVWWREKIEFKGGQ